MTLPQFIAKFNMFKELFMLKEIYKKLFKIKYAFFKHFYKPGELMTPEAARQFLLNSYSKTTLETDYNEPFLYDASLDLSVIVPVYNVEKLLRTCVESCIEDMPYSYEILLIDDGSTDESGKICDEFAEKYDFIKVFHIQNTGVSNARNFGIVNSKGKYLFFVDSDDYIEKGSLKMLLDVAEDYEIVQGLYYKIENGNVIYKSKNILPQNIAEFSVEYGYIWGKLYKREIFRNLKQPLGYWFEDMINDLVITPLYKVKVLPRYIYNYIFNKKGITSSSKNSLKILDSYFVLEEILTNYDKFGLTFTTANFERFLYQSSSQMFARLRRYDESFSKAVFSLLCELVPGIMQKYNINKNSLSKLERELMLCFETKNYKRWKNLSVFYK